MEEGQKLNKSTKMLKHKVNEYSIKKMNQRTSKIDNTFLNLKKERKAASRNTMILSVKIKWKGK